MVLVFFIHFEPDCGSVHTLFLPHRPERTGGPWFSRKTQCLPKTSTPCSRFRPRVPFVNLRPLRVMFQDVPVKGRTFCTAGTSGSRNTKSLALHLDFILCHGFVRFIQIVAH